MFRLFAWLPRHKSRPPVGPSPAEMALLRYRRIEGLARHYRSHGGLLQACRDLLALQERLERLDRRLGELEESRAEAEMWRA